MRTSNFCFIAGRIHERETLFTYEGGHSYASFQNPNFVPSFIEPVITIEIKEVCGSNRDCQFDLHITKDHDLAQMSASSSQEFDTLATTFESK